MKLLTTFSFLLLSCCLHAQQARKFVVASDGTGNFTSVQQAFDAIPYNNTVPAEIYIKSGTYREKLHLDSTKDHVTITGDANGSTILTYDDHTGTVSPDGSVINTMNSQSFYIGASDVKLVHLTISNTAGLTAGQAVAVKVDGDKVFFLGCRIIGFQDTLFTSGANSRQYYKSCLIAGSTDFIFGASTALFDDCILHSRKNSHVTASSTPREHSFGYVFRNCTLESDTGLTKVSLGRPWRPFAAVVYMNCTIGAHIMPAGWDNWKNPGNEKTARFAEYHDAGPGALPQQRVAWARQLTDDEAKRYTIENILSGWKPQ